MLRGVAFTAPAGTFLALRTGDPGAAGATNASVVTTRVTATYSAAAGGSIVLSNVPSFAMTATETITHIAVFDAATAGNFLWSAVLGTPRSVVNTDTLNLNGATLSLAALAS